VSRHELAHWTGEICLRTGPNWLTWLFLNIVGLDGNEVLDHGNPEVIHMTDNETIHLEITKITFPVSAHYQQLVSELWAAEKKARLQTLHETKDPRTAPPLDIFRRSTLLVRRDPLADAPDVRRSNNSGDAESQNPNCRIDVITRVSSN
jgi:hypothetical protein